MRLLPLGPVILLAALAACGKSAEEKAASDARDVAMVEAAQRRRPPVVPLRPEPITAAEVQANALSGAGCAFISPGGTADEPIAYLDDTRAVMKLEGALAQFASDKGSAELPYKSREHYAGRKFDLRLVKTPGEGVPAGEESMRWPASMTVRDRYGREVYAASGTLECGA